MFAARLYSYYRTNSFSKIVIDYLDKVPQLQSFYSFPPDLEGIQKAIEQKKLQGINRKVLVDALKEQYGTAITEPVQHNIELLLSKDTFTVCTAHQPNLFTGPLYFVYKILHAVKLAAYLKSQLPAYNFVPVYYMGSEDADAAELNHYTVRGKRYDWTTAQKGAVGRMKIDKKVLTLIDDLQHQIGIEPYGKEMIGLLRECFQLNSTVQEATLRLVDRFFGKYGLVVLIADDHRLKKSMRSIFEEDLFHQKPSQIVSASSQRLNEQYNAQAHPREINLFYLKDDIRERIVATNGHFAVYNTPITFTEEEIRNELKTHPERFSPNVILRALYQETILPDVAFIGGGGELAYWLQLKDLFSTYQVPYPILILRNSFQIVEKREQELINKLGLEIADFFQSEDYLMKLIVQKNSVHNVHLNGKLEKAETLFEQIRQQAGDIDPTLSQHVLALKARSLKTLQELEKKMLRAEKRKFSDQQRQIRKVKDFLFPKNGLQERVENLSGFYSKWGPSFIDALYEHSLALEQQFVVLMQNV